MGFARTGEREEWRGKAIGVWPADWSWIPMYGIELELELRSYLGTK